VIHVVDIDGIVDHHRLEAIVHVVDIGGIGDHHWYNSTNINNLNNRL
jgi:hypothetical protein